MSSPKPAVITHKPLCLNTLSKKRVEKWPSMIEPTRTDWAHKNNLLQPLSPQRLKDIREVIRHEKEETRQVPDTTRGPELHVGNQNYLSLATVAKYLLQKEDSTCPEETPSGERQKEELMDRKRKMKCSLN